MPRADFTLYFGACGRWAKAKGDRRCVRTYVRIGPRPWKPEVELEGALERGQLDSAILLAAEVREHRRLDLATALRFLPLVAAERPEQFDAWACRWFARWLTERRATIEQAAEVASTLADLPSDPRVVVALSDAAA